MYLGVFNMESGRILIAMCNEASIGKLRPVLVENGYTVVDSARDGSECLRKVRALKPDLVVLDHALATGGGADISKVILEDNLSDIILITSLERETVLESVKTSCNYICMGKPINRQNLINTIELIVKNRKKIKRLEKEIEELRANLDTRKEVEKAKGLLMKHLSLTEAEAFKRIQKQSMDRGISMKEIAKAIILAYDI